MAFCQLGLAPSAAVSTLKSEGQRGDVSIDTLLEITLSAPELLEEHNKRKMIVNSWQRVE